MSEQPNQQASQQSGPTEHLDKLKEALDSSSDKNRNFLIVFLLLEFYIFIAVLGTTDLDLFLASSFYTFPFIQFKISLEQFYLVAPLLLLAFHFNLLFNFLEHCKTLRAWLDEVNDVGPEHGVDQDEQFNLLRAFIINTRAKYFRVYASNTDAYEKKARHFDYTVLNSVFVSFVFVFPLALQVFILWKFAAFQSLGYTVLHAIAVIATITFMWRYWPGIQHPILSVRHSRQINFASIHRHKWLFSWIMIAMLVVSIRGYYTLQYYFSEQQNPKPWFSWLKPTLTIEDKEIKILASNAIERTVSSAAYDAAKKVLTDGNTGFSEMLHCQNNEQYQEIALKGRSFKGLILKEVVICDVNLKEADLTFATIEDSAFSGRFDEVIFNYGELNKVHLQINSGFLSAKFVGTKAIKLNANHIGFIAADFSNANFIESEFNHSRFESSAMKGAEFANSSMLAANFNNAKDFDASVGLAINVKFDGCILLDNAITNSKVNFDSCEVIATAKNNSDNIAIAKHEVDDKPIDSKPIDDAINESKPKPEETKPTETAEENNANNNTRKVTFPQKVLDRIAAVKSNNASEIKLNGFGLTQLPSELLALTQIKHIELNHNQLDHHQIRLLINAMPNLERLWLYGNQLTQIPDNIHQLQKLKSLDLSNNPLVEPMNQVAKLTALTGLNYLYLYGLSLDYLPASFSKLNKLQTLRLSHNKFTQVPKVVWQLTKLKVLNMNRNQLNSISPEIAKLTKLGDLRVHNNRLKTLPAQLAKLPITWFSAAGNQLVYPPQKMADEASGFNGDFNILKQWFADNPSVTHSSDNSQLNSP